MKFSIVYLCVATVLSLSGSTNAQTCIERIDQIYTAEATVTDTSIRRTYVMCPRRILEIGTLTHNFDLQRETSHPPLPLRPNMTIQCGDTGARDNICWITGGDVHIDGTPFRGISDPSVEGVQISGLTFIAARMYSTWVTKPGDITFTDCEWRNHTTSVVPVMLDFFDGTDAELSVVFDNADFHGNRFFGWGSHSSLVYANGQQNALTFLDTNFYENDMVFNNTLSSTNSFIVETLGPLAMERTCFQNNVVGVSNVVVFGSEFVNTDNFMTNSTGPICGFASVFENLQQFDTFTPLCVNAAAGTCLAGLTASPSSSPSMVPTPMASDSPSMSPTDRPSASPTGPPPTISPAPTLGAQNTPEPNGFDFPTQPPAQAPAGSSAATCKIVIGLVSSLIVALLLG